ncbi:hypothetical protein BWQ96_09253 [Gracilariopsis chorda]|uniref:Uncharacterized protein n=1 Tax=Gracilariopsis chorda TaxID=448386 RepID=A0A2V3IG81_9FLOR|nr:hypothetical protein BWQ96_09253 [Gracilariopsis chorda]|eukprot:PXF41038.1 hypothetical protein BWQ96_09253 [Gracilariopsis chorda]
MVQKQLTPDWLHDFIAPQSGNNAQNIELYRLPSTTVKIQRTEDKSEIIEWVRGDAPEAVDGKIMTNSSNLSEPEQSMGVSVDGRRPDFKAREFGRLLYVLAGTRMTAARQKLMECYDREQLDQEIGNPWEEEVASLFRDMEFKPQANAVLTGGATKSDRVIIS